MVAATKADGLLRSRGEQRIGPASHVPCYHSPPFFATAAWMTAFTGCERVLGAGPIARASWSRPRLSSSERARKARALNRERGWSARGAGGTERLKPVV